jgi:hypothetical protein
MLYTTGAEFDVVFNAFKNSVLIMSAMLGYKSDDGRILMFVGYFMTPCLLQRL